MCSWLSITTTIIIINGAGITITITIGAIITTITPTINDQGAG
jgi:hypothetical protein